MIELVEHRVDDFNRRLTIQVMDEPSPGQPPAFYRVTWDSETSECVDVRFQDGDPTKVGPNGLTNEALLAILLHRLRTAEQDAGVEHEIAVRLLETTLSLLAAKAARAKAETAKKEETPTAYVIQDPPFDHSLCRVEINRFPVGAGGYHELGYAVHGRQRVMTAETLTGALTAAAAELGGEVRPARRPHSPSVDDPSPHPFGKSRGYSEWSNDQ